MILGILYTVSVLFSWIVLFRNYHHGKKSHKFTYQEVVLGLVIIPLVPIFNVIVAIFQLSVDNSCGLRK